MEMCALVSAVFIMLVSLSGALFATSLIGTWMKTNLTYLATFSAGVFSVVLIHLIVEIAHDGSSLAFGLGTIIFGAAFMEALHHLLPPEHHHHDVNHGHTHSLLDGRRVLLSDALHNVGDGVLLVASFSVSWTIGIVATIGIVIHELVQEVSEFFVLREAGYSTVAALSWNFLSSTTVLIGVAFATYLSSSASLAILFTGLAAGGFLAVLLRDLLPHAMQSIRENGGAGKHIVALFCGVALMTTVQAIFSHTEFDDTSLKNGITFSARIPNTLN